MPQRTSALAIAAAAVLLTAACTAAEKPGSTSGLESEVGRYATPNPGSVNLYWIEAPEGLILVDGLRTVSDAEAALEKIEATGKPVVGVLVTHAHPDHVGGLSRIREAFPDAVIVAAEAAATEMATDSKGFYSLTHEQLGDEYPTAIAVPDSVVAAGEPIDLGGLEFATAEYGPGETDSSTVYFDSESNSLFPGDLLNNEATPALLEGHSCGWLVNLDALESGFPDAETAYPGHGAPGDAHLLIARQRDYLLRFRELVAAAIDPMSMEAEVVTPEEATAVISDMDAEYPDYPSVASIPDMPGRNIAAVAAEMTAEDPATLPAACAVA